MSRHVNIPIFVPHLGCPNQCEFCNQRAISGREAFSLSAVRGEIEAVLSSSGDATCEIAFFGGSFTGIDRELMLSLLDLAAEYVAGGRVSGIRMSTRPDYIDPEIVEILRRYPVCCVELGVQSTDDSVLACLKRGHTAADTALAFSLLGENRIPAAGQMMIGLPGATPESELATAEAICKMGAVAARIYPTLVFRETELAAWTAAGEYTPLSLEVAVERSKNVFAVFLSHGVPCLRIGLCESENLHSDRSFVAGPNHSAIGELVMAALYRDRIFAALPREDLTNRKLVITCPQGHVSRVVGHRAATKKELLSRCCLAAVRVEESPQMTEYTVNLTLT